jgi:outer membrane protein OmpA-like peptidoglycan-associated protein
MAHMTTDSGEMGAQTEQELKQLLFSRELAQLSDLQRRADQIDARVGDGPALTESVETVLVEVLRTAQARDHERVASALAPLIVSSMRAEIRNSRDMMVEALYPITGRLVAAAVKDAIKQAFEQVDQKLDSALSFDRWRARIISRVTGRSQAEILLRYRPRFRVEAFLVADRATGSPIARHGGFGRKDGDGESDDELFAGMLNATLTFARNALRETEGGDLRRLDFGGAELFLRTSPTLLLAVRTAGPPPADIDQQLERLFVDFLSANRQSIDVSGPISPESGAEFSDDLLQRLNAVSASSAKQSKGPPWKGLIAAAVIAAIGLWFGGNMWLERSARADLKAEADAIIASIPELTGYRVEAAVDDNGLSITGLAPTQAILDSLRTSLASTAAEAEAPLTIAVSALPAPAAQNASAVADALLPEVERRLEPLSRTVADVAFRTQDLEDTVEDNAGRAAAQAATVSALQSDQADARAGLAATALSAESARRQIAADIASQFAQVDGAVAAVERTQDRAAERLAKTRVALNAADDRLARVTATLTALLEQVRSDTASLATTANTTNTKIDETSRALTTVATSVEDISSRIHVETDRITAAERALAALAATPAATQDNTDQISTLAADINALRIRIASLAEADANQTQALAQAEKLAASLSEIELAVSKLRTAPPTATGPDPELTSRVEDLEARAGEAIAILDQRIDRIARAAEPKADSPVEAANRALRPLVVTFISSDQPNDNDEALEVLRKAADVALSMPERVNLRIVGFADSIGTVEDNRITSQRRSDWAFNALKKLGVQPDRMVSVGRGAERLLSASTEDDSPNRRVEFEAYYAINPSERD